MFEIFEEVLFDEAEFELSNEADSELGFDEAEAGAGARNVRYHHTISPAAVTTLTYPAIIPTDILLLNLSVECVI